MTMKRSPKKPEPPRRIDTKQMEKTLAELHKLQLQVYDLDSPTKIPFKNSPVKREIKQLITLHQNMLKPKKRNKLGISKQAIRDMFHTLQKKESNSIPISLLRKFFTPIFKSDYEFELISAGKNDITVDQLYQYLNYSEFDDFDVEREVFALLDPEATGKVNLKQLEQYMQMLGYSTVSKEMLQKILNLQTKDITFDIFKKLMKGIDLKQIHQEHYD